jgi:N-acetylmuramoyl-L-alanine amidase
MMQPLRFSILVVLAFLPLLDSAAAQNPGRRPEPGRPQQSDRAPHLSPAVGVHYGGEYARLTAIRLSRSEGNTRVLMEVSGPVLYEIGRLPADAALGMPPRLYIDIAATTLAMESQAPIFVSAGAVTRIRVGQFTPDVVRVVLETNGDTAYSAFLLPEPFQVVLELHDAQPAEMPRVTTKTDVPGPRAPGTRARLETTGIRKIVLDPGHGGRDPGAIGPGGVTEKEIVLRVAKRLAEKLRKEMGVQVWLTRSDDRFIALEDRTAVANAHNADLFVSLHMNASPNAEARGVETYYLDNTSDEASIRLAARENATSRKNVSDLQFILSDLTQNMKLEDSVSLAHHLQGALVATNGTHLHEIKDLGVKKALFYVLVGARMPSVLVEMFFISNRDEARAMSQSQFQDAVVDALYNGIQQYNRSVLAAKTL